MNCDYIRQDGKWICAMCKQPPIVNETEERECDQPVKIQAVPKRKGCNCGRRHKPR